MYFELKRIKIGELAKIVAYSGCELLVDLVLEEEDQLTKLLKEILSNYNTTIGDQSIEGWLLDEISKSTAMEHFDLTDNEDTMLDNIGKEKAMKYFNLVEQEETK